MALLCLLYFAAVGICLGAAGLLVEQALPVTAPRRWVWCVVIVASMVIPVTFSMQHTAPAIEIGGYTVLSLSAGENAGSLMRALMSPTWLDCKRAFYAQPLLRTSAVWSAVLLIIALANWVRVSRVLGRSRDDASPSVVDGVPLTVTKALGPATFGLVRTRVLVPRWVLALPGVQRSYGVRHEEEHRRAHDPLVLLVAAVLILLMPWNVPLWWQLARLRLAIEADCDQRVVAALGDAPAYGDLLLKVASALSRGPVLQPGLLGYRGALERRLGLLMTPAQRPRVVRILAPALACALVILVLSVPHPFPAAPVSAHVHHAPSGTSGH